MSEITCQGLSDREFCICIFPVWPGSVWWYSSHPTTITLHTPHTPHTHTCAYTHRHMHTWEHMHTCTDYFSHLSAQAFFPESYFVMDAHTTPNLTHRGRGRALSKYFWQYLAGFHLVACAHTYHGNLETYLLETWPRVPCFLPQWKRQFCCNISLHVL